MCTVTYIPTAKGVYLTSNRDERVTRRSALPPRPYEHQDSMIIYPRDQEAGGSWISLKQNGDTAVLLNGAFAKHVPAAAYRQSRGLIFLDIAEHSSPLNAFTDKDLIGIEPFTLILYVRKRLWECRWDGISKHALQLDPSKPYIWSSATLYDHHAAKQRKQWFLEWFSSTSPVSSEKVIGFHRNAGQDDQWNGLIINRENKMQTVSITSVFSNDQQSQMQYLETGTNVTTACCFPDGNKHGRERFAASLHLSVRKFMIRVLNREYWPFWAVYGPLLPYWIWLSIKSRSLLFFSAANPGIEYAGFTQERKSDICKLIPPQYHPRTRLCRYGISYTALLQELNNGEWNLPLIAKPDIGEKGKQVSLIRSQEQLKKYVASTRVDFLLQDYISYPQEAGIFYYRLPGESKGQISGIVGKEHLAVTGDGSSTIASLLKQHDRFVLQLQHLQATHGPYLQTIPDKGVSVTLAPYGNHARGAKFTDMSENITGKLTDAIDEVCRQIPGFFYGRLDVKFNTWKELEEGKNFCIIELNGAGSEPTHIYDPSHSIFFAWKEIRRHWSLLQQISIANKKRSGIPLMTFSQGIRLIRNRTGYLKKLINT